MKGKASPAFSNDFSKTSISDEDLEELDDRATSALRLRLTKNILANVRNGLMVKEL